MNWKKWLTGSREKKQDQIGSRNGHKQAMPVDAIVEQALHTQTKLKHTDNPHPSQPEQQIGALGSPAVLAHINQQWMTPLSHIRSAIDVLGRMEHPARGRGEQVHSKQQHSDSLALLQNASYQLHASIENIIDYHEITAGRLTNTPGPLRPCALGEDLVSSWQAPAQRAGHLLVFACDQDVPETVSLDPELTHRLLDRLTGMLLATTGISEPAVRCNLIEHPKADYARLAISFDAKPSDPRDCLTSAISKLATELPDHLQTLLEEDTIDSWIVQKLAALLGADLFIGPTQENLGRYGIRLELTVPVTQACLLSEPILAEKRVAVVTKSEVQARALRSQFVGFGAFILPIDSSQPPPDMIFADQVSWKILSEQPAFTNWLERKPVIIGLANAITIRGRPRHAQAFADFTLPGFIPTRALEKSLHRILRTNIEQRRKEREKTARQRTKQTPEKTAQHDSLRTAKGDIGTALIVDDDPIYITHLSRLLEPMGFALLTASSGKEAMGCADANRVDVVLTDMHMPDITGAGVARMLRRHPRYRDTPVLAITANRQSAVHQDLRAAGIQQVLTKPVSSSELQAALSPFFDLTAHNHTDNTTNNPPPANDPFLIQLLCEELPSYLEQLQKPRGNLDETRHAAHKLRGAAGCCQQTELKNRAEQLEKAIIEQQSEQHIEADKQALLTCIINLQRTLECTTTK